MKDPEAKKDSSGSSVISEGDHKISYPSGRVFNKSGKLVEGWIDDKTHAVLIDPGPDMPLFVLDQRAFIEFRGKVVWNPREHMDKLLPFMRKWMEENPSWPVTPDDPPESSSPSGPAAPDAS